MLRKYMKLQEDLELKYGKNSVVLYMKGSFYELYSLDIDKKQIGDLHTVSKILNITLTKSNKSLEHSENNPYMCGFPSYALRRHPRQ